MKFQIHEIDQIKEYVHIDSPLGPIGAEDIEDPYVSKILFAGHNNIYQNISTHPSIVIGRRGSGKTAYLKNLQFSSKYNVSILIKSEESFREIITSVQNSIENNEFIYVEEVAKLWHTLFWMTIISAIGEKYPNESGKLTSFKKTFEIFGFKANFSPDSIIRTVLNVLKKRASDEKLGLSAEIFYQLLEEKDTSFEELKNNTYKLLKSKKTRAIILMDSLEDFRLDIPDVRQAIAGLFKTLGKFNLVKGRPEIRFCLPSELYDEFVECSTNKAKDLGQVLLIHWHSGDLLSLAAHRFKVYLNIYQIGTNDFRNELNKINISTRVGAKKFFLNVLPNRIKNLIGTDELPIIYILRHTQLLPRQILRYLNKIIQLSDINNEHIISEHAIRKGIINEEGFLLSEVFTGFEYKYPKAQEICKDVVPELPLRFNNGKLHKIFNQKASKHYDSNEPSYTMFKRMLIEIGCIGVVIKTTKSYIVGKFEYSMPDTLNPSDNDELCLHPLFCGGIKGDSLAEKGIKQVVYPYGTNPLINILENEY